MKKGLTSGLVLLVLGTVCGLVLGLVNYFTAPIIAANELAEKLETLKQFYPNISTDYAVEEITLDGAIDTVFVLTHKTDPTLDAAIYSVQSMGYQTPVRMLIAINKDLTVKGYAILGTGGTAGIGLDYLGLDFGMTGSPVSDTTGSFDGVSGATITSTAVRTCFELVAARVSIDLGGN